MSVHVTYLQLAQRELSRCPTLRLAWHVRLAPSPPTLGPQAALSARQEKATVVQLIAMIAIMGGTQLKGPPLVQPAPQDITNRAIAAAAAYCAQEECTDHILTIGGSTEAVMRALRAHTHHWERQLAQLVLRAPIQWTGRARAHQIAPPTSTKQ